MANRLLDNPIEELEREHALHAVLCDTLEQIADSLPDDVDLERCAWAQNVLTRDLPLHHRDEDQGLFPLLKKRTCTENELSAHLAQLSEEHMTDESFAQEIAEEFACLLDGSAPRNPEMLGYMLRGFFESYRRHLHWENLVLLPMARQHLTTQDLLALSETMLRHRTCDNRSD